MTADVRRSPRRGTSSACAQSACDRGRHERSSHALRGRVLRSVLRPVHVDPHYAPQTQVSVVGRSSQHHGWANPLTWEEPALGLERTDGARLAACHRFRKGDRVVRSEKEGGRGLRPCEDPRVPVWLPARRLSLQKSVGGVWSRISSAHALQKERSGSSERGPSSERMSAGDTVGRRIARNDEPRVGLTAMTGEDRRRLRVARDRHPAVATSPKAVWRSWGRGCNGHRILRRVPAE
jgi:hypothetical protein